MPAPHFSVIVPSYRRPDRLARCLEGLAALDYPRHCYEVIVVDDGSPGGLSGAIDPWRTRLDLQHLTQKNAGPASARNRGARHAQYEYLAFIDDDCVSDPGWLTAFARGFENDPDRLLGGHVRNALNVNLFSGASQDLVTYLCGYYDGEGGRSRLFTSNNMAVRADHFHQLGGFDATFPRAAGEDRDFCDRWAQQERGSTYVGDARVLHAHALTLVAFCRQHFDYGRAAASFHNARAARRGEPVRLEAWPFYAGLVGFPLREELSLHACGRSMLLVLSQIANAGGFAWARLIASEKSSPPP